MAFKLPWLKPAHLERVVTGLNLMYQKLSEDADPNSEDFKRVQGEWGDLHTAFRAVWCVKQGRAYGA